MFKKLISYSKTKAPLVILLSSLLVVAAIFVKGTILTNKKDKQTIIQTAEIHKKVLGAEHMPTDTPTPIISKNPTNIPSPVTPLKIGIVVDDYANKTNQLSLLQQSLGITFATVSIYKQFGLPTNNMLLADDLNYIKSHQIKLLIAWEPWNPQEGMHQSKDYLQEIIKGNQDAYVKTFAQSVKSYANPVIIRFAHEMNGDWYPWGKRPQEYIQAYRRIIELFRNENVQNVSWMWSINATPLGNLADYYPGDTYVDSIGIDGFNFGASQPSGSWMTISQIFQPAYNFITARYSKPLVISETASTEQGGNKADWIKNMFVILPQNMPKIQEIIWFDLNKETDWRIDSSPASFTAFSQNDK